MDAAERSPPADPGTAAVLHALERSAAPRFLVSLLELPAGEYLIPVDDASLGPQDRRGDLVVSAEGGERRAELRYVNSFSTEAARQIGLEPVYTHILIRDGELRLHRGTDPYTPETHQQVQAIQDLVDEVAIAEFCEVAGLAMDAGNAGRRPPNPIEAHPTPDHA